MTKQLSIVVILAALAVSSASAQEKIVYAGPNGPSNIADVFIMNPDGSNKINLTNLSTSSDNSPSLCPGFSIAFTSNRDGKLPVLRPDIFIMKANGGGQTNLTPGTPDSDEFAPDCKTVSGRPTIVFSSNRDGNYEIYRMQTNGTRPTRLTNNAVGDSDPAWCGDRIVFVRGGDLFVMDQRGGTERQLTCTPFPEFHPACSPDGTQIAFARHVGNAQIFRMDMCPSLNCCTGEVQLTAHPASDMQPTWSPDATEIAWSGNRENEGDFEIYKMNAQNGEPPTGQLTNNQLSDTSPDWGVILSVSFPP